MKAAPCKISIIVSSFNTEKLIARCLTSLVKQTYEDIGIPVIDDGSRDNLLIIIREYAECYLKIRFFSQENPGARTARNLGLRKAVGEYIMFCDADDTFEPGTCENRLGATVKRQIDVVMRNANIHGHETAVIPKEGKPYEFNLKQGRYFANPPSLRDINPNA